MFKTLSIVAFAFFVCQSNVSTDHMISGIFTVSFNVSLTAPYGGRSVVEPFATKPLMILFVPSTSLKIPAASSVDKFACVMEWLESSHPCFAMRLIKSPLFCAFCPSMKKVALELYFSSWSSNSPVRLPGPSSNVNAIIGLLGSMELSSDFNFPSLAN